MNPFRRYARWLHTQWPAGTVEKLPVVGPDGGTNVPGLWVAGDLTGIPLLKFALDTGARVVERIAARPSAAATAPDVLELVIVGAGVSGMAAAIEAKRRGIGFEILEAAEPFFTLVNFPQAKPIYIYPRSMKPAGALQVSADVKEALIGELRDQTQRAGIVPAPGRAARVTRDATALRVHLEDGSIRRARNVLIAIGKSGAFRRLGVPGETRPKVYNRLHDPTPYADQRAMVVGGGDSAVEAAILLARAGAHVTLCHRGAELSRPKPENLEKLAALMRDPRADVTVEHPTSELVTTALPPMFAARPGSIALRLGARVREIREHAVVLATASGEVTDENDVVFVMIGREAPVEFLRRSGIPLVPEMTPRRWLALGAFLASCAWLYDWKSGGWFSSLWYARRWFPTNLPDLLATAGGVIAAQAREPGTLIGTLAISGSQPAFWYTLAYSIVIVVFGVRRIRRRRTPYVTVQTLVLMSIQVLPLFLIPEILLPLLGAHGLLPRGLADALFPVVSYGHGREYWRAYGLILAWPLDVYNVFTAQPLWAWIAIGFVQTCVLIPLGIRYFGKGFYCGWICSCGALAETLGDTHRDKMPHGPLWNRMNLAGQVVLGVAFALLAVRIAGWALPHGNWAERVFPDLASRYKWTVDVFLAGVVGYGVYFWFSGRFWCRFLCPLAALMHVYARFSAFRILADKKKCISCGQCTRYCHQGIDVMSFANKGTPMADPECVRCSACVEVCPTGVLSFGRVNRAGDIVALDTLEASPVRMRERE